MTPPQPAQALRAPHIGPKSPSMSTTSSVSTAPSEPLSSASSGLYPASLPRSVRNMPPEARLLIRRRQNNDSLRRGRERRRREDKAMRAKAKENEDAIRELEKRAASLQKELLEKRRLKEQRKVRKNVIATPGEYFERCVTFGDPF